MAVDGIYAVNPVSPDRGNQERIERELEENRLEQERRRQEDDEAVRREEELRREYDSHSVDEFA